ncbi:MAG: DUF1232 domain-containing protein [Planctomycetaceae bacterium]|nr:DUF1232 domain-containing protein [Planctomycetaceae bacterium]
MNLVERVKTLWKLFTGGGMSKADKIIMLIAVVYCLSPIDIIPDVAPMVGFLDDFLVILATLRHLSNKPETAEASAETEKTVDATVL